jgi:hypothetical protein
MAGEVAKSIILPPELIIRASSMIQMTESARPT